MKNLPTALIISVFIATMCHGMCAEALRSASAPTTYSVSGAGNSFNPAFSADGRYVVFVSQANNLVTNDDRLPYLDVFVHDLVNTNTDLISVSASGWGGGDADCNYPSISSNGQFVVFASSAGNLVLNDTNGAADIFLRDLNAGATHLVSVDLEGSSPSPLSYQQGNMPLSGNPLISGNGQFVFFESLATNLSGVEDANNARDIFVRDTVAQTTRLISINAAGMAAGSGASALGSITPDARWAAFTSKATNLVNGSRPSAGQEIFVRDLHLEQTYWASVDALGSTGSGTNFYAPVLSANGVFLYFKKAAVNPSTAPEELWRFDLQTQAAICIATNALPYDLPAASPDGDYVVYAGLDGLYAWDQTTQTNRFIGCGSSPALASRGAALAYKVSSLSCGTSGQVGIYSKESLDDIGVRISVRAAGTKAGIIEPANPAISPDGRFVAFESLDEGIVTNDLNQASDVFVRDRLENSTRMISQRRGERPALTGAGLAALKAFGDSLQDQYYARKFLNLQGCVSGDGTVAVFSTMDSSLEPGDTNDAPDVFAKYLQTGEVVPISVKSVDGTNGSFIFGRGGFAPVISGNGKHVAWTWSSGNATESYMDTPHEDVYVRDLVTQTNYKLVSRTVRGTSTGSSSQPAISSDGTMVAFRSAAPDLVDYVQATSSSTAIYVRYLNTGTNQAVSVSLDGRWVLGNCMFPIFSPDDEWVLFQSKATLTTNTFGNIYQIFARNLKTQTTRFISYKPDGTGLDSDAGSAVFSANSRYVAFQSSSTIYRHDLQANTTNLVVCEDCMNPSITADGRFVVYQTLLSITPSPTIGDVYIKDMVTGETNLISVDRSGTVVAVPTPVRQSSVTTDALLSSPARPRTWLTFLLRGQVTFIFATGCSVPPCS